MNLIVENVTHIKSEITTIACASVEIQKNMCKKDYFWNPATCCCKKGKYVGNIIGDLVITCDEIIEATQSTSRKTVPEKSTSTKSVPTKSTSTNFYISFSILLISMALLIAVSIYCYLVKY